MKSFHLLKPSGRFLLVSAMALGLSAGVTTEAHATSIQAVAGQHYSVSGKITDPTGESIIGATVMVKGTNSGTATDIEGNFKINAASPSGTLIISYVGYKTVEVNYHAGTPVDITLREDTSSLQEVVVVGYGTQRKEELSSSVTSVKADDFVQTTKTDVASLVRGKVAGLAVVSPDGNPLSSSQISLRGVATLNSSTDPLVIIDGVPGSLNSVSANDIAQIDVLKDGSAAAIYGTRGTNGVIIITTKGSKSNTPATIEFNGYVSFQSIKKKLPMLSAAQYREKVREGFAGTVDNGYSTDWLDETLRSPVSQTYSINLKGGGNNTNYIVSFDYTSNEGIVKNSKVDMLYPRINVVHRMFDNKLRIEANMNAYQRKYGTGYSTDVYQSALIFNPTSPVKDEEGNYTEIARDLIYNPVALLNETKGENKETNLRMFSGITVTPIDGLDIKLLLSNETSNTFSGYYETKKHKSNTVYNKNGYASRSTYRNENNLIELTAQYNKTIHGEHHLNALAGYSWNKWNYQSASMSNYGFPSDDYTYNNIGVGSAINDGMSSMSSYQSENTLIGFFARVNYNFSGKYFVSASLRHEGSSKFGKDHKWGNFPAISAAWNMKGESFLKNVEILSNLKIRAGFGITGTEPGSPYISLNSLDLGGLGYYNGQWINSLRPGGNPNPDLRWEKKEELNIGLDFGFFNDRISGSLDFYNRDTKDLIGSYQVPLPPYYSSWITANAGSMRNRGIEVSLNFTPVATREVTWNSSLNFSTNSNKLLSLSNDKYMSDSYQDAGNTLAPIQQPTHRIQEGEAIGNFYGYESIDIDENGYWIIKGEDGNPKPIKEQNSSDKKVLGNGLPKYYLNWNNSIRFKRFDLSITMRGAFDFQILNMAEMHYAAPVSLLGGDNVMAKAFDKIYGKRQLAADQELQYVSYFVQDGDYWKIDNITLGYNFNVGKIKFLKELRVYGSVSNLATITKYSGIDPEVGISGLTPGVDDRYRYPSTRTFTLGLNLTF